VGGRFIWEAEGSGRQEGGGGAAACGMKVEVYTELPVKGADAAAEALRLGLNDGWGEE